MIFIWRFNGFCIASENSEEEEPPEKEEPKQKPQEDAKIFRKSQAADPNLIVSDDEDFEADLKLAQQQQKNFEHKNINKQDHKEVFDEELGSNKNLSLIHQQYNTDAISGGVSASKAKKKKKRQHKNANKTAIEQPKNGLNESDNFADPGGNYQKGTFCNEALFECNSICIQNW